MGLALYIVLDNENPGFDTFVNGKTIAKEEKKLDSISKKLAIPKLSDFICLAGDEIDDVPEEVKWFKAEDGIKWIEALTRHIQENPKSVNNQSAILEDLAEYRNVFTQSQTINAKWHLSIDI